MLRTLTVVPWAFAHTQKCYLQRVIIIKQGSVFSGTLQNQCPNIFIIALFEILDAMKIQMLNEIVTLYSETLNQRPAATKTYWFAINQMDETTTLGIADANLPHFISRQKLIKPILLYDVRHIAFCGKSVWCPAYFLSSKKKTRQPLRTGNRVLVANLAHALTAAWSTQTKVSVIRARGFATTCLANGEAWISNGILTRIPMVWNKMTTDFYFWEAGGDWPACSLLASGQLTCLFTFGIWATHK